jgi:hypothetical protein
LHLHLFFWTLMGYKVPDVNVQYTDTFPTHDSESIIWWSWRPGMQSYLVV